jgi:hypothetical protein
VQGCVITETEAARQALHTALRTLARNDRDHARTLNGIGFSKHDSSYGHSLAACPSVSARQAMAAARLIVKYQRQLDADVVALARQVLQAESV